MQPYNHIQLTILPVTHPSHYGAGLSIHYAAIPGPFGLCFIAACELGICYLGFPQASGKQALLDWIRQEWPQADFMENEKTMGKLADSIFRSAKGQTAKVVLKGTDFQISVWKALLTIPQGVVTNYTDIAQQIKKPKAVRAVGTAIGKNPVSYLVPCHRVVPKSGGTGKYLWGTGCKEKLLEYEGALLPVK